MYIFLLKRMTLDTPRQQREKIQSFIRRFHMMFRSFETAALYSENSIARTVAFGQVGALLRESSQLLPRVLPDYAPQIFEAVETFLGRVLRDLDDEDEDVIEELEDLARDVDPRIRRILLNQINRRLRN